MTFPEGRYSVRDTMEEIAKNEEAFAITAKAIKLAINVDLKPDMDMWNHDQSHNRGDCYKNGQSAEWFLGEPERPAYQNQKAAIKFAPNPGYFIWYWGHILALISSAKYRFELLLSAIPRPALVFAGTRFPTSDRSSHRPHHG